MVGQTIGSQDAPDCSIAPFIRATTLVVKASPSPLGETLFDRWNITGVQLLTWSSAAFSASQSMRSRSATGTYRWIGGGSASFQLRSTRTTSFFFVSETI